MIKYIRLFFLLLLLFFPAESDILASTATSCPESCTLVKNSGPILPLGLLPSVRVVTECRTVAVLTFYGPAVVCNSADGVHDISSKFILLLTIVTCYLSACIWCLMVLSFYVLWKMEPFNHRKATYVDNGLLFVSSSVHNSVPSKKKVFTTV